MRENVFSTLTFATLFGRPPRSQVISQIGDLNRLSASTF
jgi:hypothetical protein